MPQAQDQPNPITNGALLDTPKAVWIIVVGALLALILIRRGFRGVSVGGVSVGVS